MTAPLAALLMATPALAQDSVADSTASGGDALSPYTTQTTRYVLDLVEFQSSWSTSFFIGPIAKASRDDDVLFNTLALGSSALSPDLRTSVAFPNRSYSTWNTRGQGVAPENTAPSSLVVSGYDAQFGVGFSEFNAEATNVSGLLVGLNTQNLSRLFVQRTMAAHSRISAGTDDTGTLSIGAIDAHGNVHVRADGFNSEDANQLFGENLLRIGLLNRSSGMNGLFQSGSTVAFDASASTFLINEGGTATNTPAAFPESMGGPISLLLDFAGEYAPDALAPTTAHLAGPIEAHRGNPHFAATTDFGGVGAVASLARSNAGAGLVDSLNVFSIDASGGVVATDSATLPSPMPGFPSLNAAGDAQFLQYLSQVCFRGPSGLVAIGHDSINDQPILAATATDPTAGDFIAVARFTPAPVWTVAARVGSSVLDGPGGAMIGQIVSTAPASISAPAADSLGNIYFLAAFDPTLGPVSRGLFKAVNTPSGYQLELLLAEGDEFTGANSATDYVIDRLILADSDSIASAAPNAASVLQPQIPSNTTTDPADSRAFGGLIVAADITYNNLGSAESYQALLFVGPFAAPVLCVGDLDNDGDTDVFDFNIFAPAFGSTGLPPFTGGDLDGDGDVDVFDFNIFAPDFGCGT